MTGKDTMVKVYLDPDNKFSMKNFADGRKSSEAFGYNDTKESVFRKEWT